jgi:hypothetical protein
MGSPRLARVPITTGLTSQLVKAIIDADTLAKLPISRCDKSWLTEWAAAASAQVRRHHRLRAAAGPADR